MNNFSVPVCKDCKTPKVPVNGPIKFIDLCDCKQEEQEESNWATSPNVSRKFVRQLI
jgi:hypothetical protein